MQAGSKTKKSKILTDYLTNNTYFIIQTASIPHSAIDEHSYEGMVF